MNRIGFVLVAALCFVSATRSDEPAGKNWPQWRGPSGQGHVHDDRVPLEWSGDKNVLWKTKLPAAGHSTPIIWSNKVFLTCSNADGTQRWVVCLDSTDGKLLWQDLASRGIAEKTHQTSTHASPSCVTDGKYVWAFFGTPGIYCYDMNGKRIWAHKFGIFTSETNWGIGASPVLAGDLVIVNCDNDGARFLPPGRPASDCAPASLIALNKTTGKVVWQTPRDQGRGFSTPVLISVKGREELVLNGPLGIWAYDPKTGKELWHCNRHPDDDRNKFGEPLPLFREGIMYAAAGRESGFLQAIRLGGSGDVTKTHLVWEARRQGVRDVGSGILAGDFLIYADSRQATISAHDAATGRQLYKVATKGAAAGRGRGFYSSPILLNGHVFCLRQDGTTFVIEPGPELKIVRQNVLSDGTDFSASPAVADGKIFLRSQTHLYCIGTPAK